MLHGNTMSDLSELNIISINVNSIIKNQRRASLLYTIEKYSSDILLLGETKLNKNHILRFENYNIIRNDRNADNAGGGTAIIIKKGINYSAISGNITNNYKILECTIIKCKLKSNQFLYIIAAYAKCGAQKEFIPELDDLFQKLKLNETENYFLLAGNLNAKHIDWRNRNNNPRGISLCNWIKKNDLKYRIKLLCSKYPSYPNGQSFLDLVLADTRLTFKNLEDGVALTNVPYDSDHNALLLKITMGNENEILHDIEGPNKKFNYKKTNWVKFNSRHI